MRTEIGLIHLHAAIIGFWSSNRLEYSVLSLHQNHIQFYSFQVLLIKYSTRIFQECVHIQFMRFRTHCKSLECIWGKF